MEEAAAGKNVKNTMLKSIVHNAEMIFLNAMI